MRHGEIAVRISKKHFISSVMDNSAGEVLNKMQLDCSNFDSLHIND